jgi:hypothetical protein
MLPFIDSLLRGCSVYCFCHSASKRSAYPSPIRSILGTEFGIGGEPRGYTIARFRLSKIVDRANVTALRVTGCKNAIGIEKNDVPHVL